jgi:hypothetical protein
LSPLGTGSASRQRAPGKRIHGTTTLRASRQIQTIKSHPKQARPGQGRGLHPRTSHARTRGETRQRTRARTLSASRARAIRARKRTKRPHSSRPRAAVSTRRAAALLVRPARQRQSRRARGQDKTARALALVVWARHPVAGGGVRSVRRQWAPPAAVNETRPSWSGLAAAPV